MTQKFIVTGWECFTQPECDPAFVARVFARTSDGQTLTLYPVPGDTVKQDWKNKTLILSLQQAPVAEVPTAIAPIATPALAESPVSEVAINPA